MILPIMQFSPKSLPDRALRPDSGPHFKVRWKGHIDRMDEDRRQKMIAWNY
jgi:hypothetical protein